MEQGTSHCLHIPHTSLTSHSQDWSLGNNSVSKKTRTQNALLYKCIHKLTVESKISFSLKDIKGNVIPLQAWCDPEGG